MGVHPLGLLSLQQQQQQQKRNESTKNGQIYKNSYVTSVKRMRMSEEAMFRGLLAAPFFFCMTLFMSLFTRTCIFLFIYLFIMLTWCTFRHVELSYFKFIFGEYCLWGFCQTFLNPSFEYSYILCYF